jgi:hypothetical protein
MFQFPHSCAANDTQMRAEKNTIARETERIARRKEQKRENLDDAIFVYDRA